MMIDVEATDMTGEEATMIGTDTAASEPEYPPTVVRG
jgi:hypothetical protein